MDAHGTESFGLGLGLGFGFGFVGCLLAFISAHERSEQEAGPLMVA
jgi:hypothetical protein